MILPHLFLHIKLHYNVLTSVTKRETIMLLLTGNHYSIFSKGNLELDPVTQL